MEAMEAQNYGGMWCPAIAMEITSKRISFNFFGLPIKSFFMEYPIPNGYGEAPNK